MQIILNMVPGPVDQVIKNLTIGDTPLGPAFESWQDLGVNWLGEMCLQGEWTTSRMPEFEVPRAMIGWNPYFAVPRQIGPMAIASGAVNMVPIGPAIPVNPIIDPTQKFLMSALPLDSTGAWFPNPNEEVIAGYAEVPWSRVLQGENPIAIPSIIANPRQEVKDSGSLKVITPSNLPDNFGRIQFLLYEAPVSYQVFQLTGTTVDGAGAALGNCRVIAYQSGWRYVDAGTTIIAETISDGSGNFSMLLRNIDYQLTAYIEGSPDKAGITRQDLTPVAATTIYLRDPTTPDTPSGGGGGLRVAGHGGLAA